MSNQAAWITEAKANPLKVDAAPMPTPDANEVVLRNYATAINPVDWKIQDYGLFLEKFPNILGCDAAGEIVAVGSSVTDFKKGDRVMAHMDGLLTKKEANNSFQHYVATNAALVSKIPSSLSYAEAAVLPLAISTASAGLYQKDFLGLPLPQAGAQPTGKVLLVWGGSSSVGSAAIQLAAASGLEVATTASAHNADFVKSLGAKHVFDHTKASVVDEIVAALKGKQFAGVYDSISTPDTIKKSAEIASKVGGNKFVATTLQAPEDLPSDVKAANVFAISIVFNEVASGVWGKYVPAALASGALQAKPDPLIIGQGLDKIQAGLAKNKAGVSAKKVIVELP